MAEELQSYIKEEFDMAKKYQDIVNTINEMSSKGEKPKDQSIVQSDKVMVL